MKTIIKIVLIVITLNFISCEKLIPDRLYSIWKVNNSNYIVYSENSVLHPDTSLIGNYNDINLINPGERLSIDSFDPWEDRFSEIFKNDTLIVFFINVDTIAKYGWESTKRDYRIIERREYSKQDLAKQNWMIYFP